jgi:hypothetical protein
VVDKLQGLKGGTNGKIPPTRALKRILISSINDINGISIVTLEE